MRCVYSIPEGSNGPLSAERNGLRHANGHRRTAKCPVLDMWRNRFADSIKILGQDICVR